MISLESVSVAYRPGVPVLHGLSLELRRGEVTVFLGPSGAGKSTLLRTMNGLVRPTSGRVRAEGVGDLSEPRRRREHCRRTGMVFQSHHLLGRLSALSNVLKGRLGYHSTLRSLWPLDRSEVCRALDCLRRVGLGDLAHARVDRLSGGERQRVGIARALAQEPTAVLADEPVASLDPANAERIMTILRGIAREDGLTVAISLHQVDYAGRFADRIVGLNGGRIVFDGGPDGLSPRTLEAIYRKPGAPGPGESPAGAGTASPAGLGKELLE